MAATVRRRRALVALAVLLLATVIATGLALVTARRNAAGAQAAVTIQRAHSGQAAPSFKGRITFLVIGSDSGAPKFGRGGTAAGGRADSIHLVVLDTGKRRGVTIGVDMNLVDHFSGANFRKGTQKVNGRQALAYSRARHGTPRGDLDRSRHQGQVLLGGLATFQKQVAKDPTQVMK